MVHPSVGDVEYERGISPADESVNGSSASDPDPARGEGWEVAFDQVGTSGLAGCFDWSTRLIDPRDAPVDPLRREPSGRRRQRRCPGWARWWHWWIARVRVLPCCLGPWPQGV